MKYKHHLKTILLTLSFLIILISWGCSEGLAPIEPEYIRGTVRFVNDIDSWPPPDSLIELRVVFFQRYPQDSTGIVAEFKYLEFTDTLETYTDSSTFTYEIIKAPIVYEYVAVAQNYGAWYEWKVVGVYSISGNPEQYSRLEIEEGRSYDIDITVDFNNLPPQPF